MQREEILKSLKEQLEATNTIKQANDKEIKRCRQRIQELELANKPLQEQSNRIYAQIQELEQPITLSAQAINTIATHSPDATLAQVYGSVQNAHLNYASGLEPSATFSIEGMTYQVDKRSKNSYDLHPIIKVEDIEI